jgi:hypothetical protein
VRGRVVVSLGGVFFMGEEDVDVVEGVGRRDFVGI